MTEASVDNFHQVSQGTRRENPPILVGDGIMRVFVIPQQLTLVLLYYTQDAIDIAIL